MSYYRRSSGPPLRLVLGVIAALWSGAVMTVVWIIPDTLISAVLCDPSILQAVTGRLHLIAYTGGCAAFVSLCCIMSCVV